MGIIGLKYGSVLQALRERREMTYVSHFNQIGARPIHYTNLLDSSIKKFIEWHNSYSLDRFNFLQNRYTLCDAIFLYLKKTSNTYSDINEKQNMNMAKSI